MSEKEKVQDSESPPGIMHSEHATKGTSVQRKLKNPLEGLTEDEVIADVDRFVESRGMQEHRDTFRKGGLVARVQYEQSGFEKIGLLNDGDKQILRDEVNHKWRHPFRLYFLCVLCAGSAIVQG